MGFTHLHVHTQFSLLDGAARIVDLVARAKELNMDALAITDHGAMYGVVDFYKECKKQGIKPIIGLETYVAPRSMEERAGLREYAHLVLLAKNNQGYKNLMKLSSEAFLRGFYYRPRIDYDLLEQHKEGLICLSACIAGDIPSLLLEGKHDEARAHAERLKGMFGGDFYIELQNHGIAEQLEVLPKLDALAKELCIKTVATNDLHYVNKDDAEAQDVLLCIQTARFVDEEDRMKMSAAEFYLKSEQEMRAVLRDYGEAIDNTAEVAEKCNVTFAFGERHLPEYVTPDGSDKLSYLTRLCEAGLKHKMPHAGDEERKRLAYELGVIDSMGFIDYFLIVWDFVDFAHRNGIIVGPGRGSGAGSLVAYALDITDVDPIKYDLIFERFLNPERISMPDFDIDFCIERRQEVIDYVTQKYGADHVSQIITFGSMAAKAVVRDVGRALRMPYSEVDKIAKLIPYSLGITLNRALEVSKELKDAYESDAQVKKLIDLSLKLEGLPRHASTHAAGVVISKDPICEHMPLQKNDEAVTTQFPMGTIEELGLLKMDFLGLRTLTVLRDALAYIEEGGKTAPDLGALSFDDPKIFDMISRADTDGVFQLESSGMRQFMMQLKPDTIEDIIAGISLFRPGPMDQIPRYVAGKNNKNDVKYLHEKLRPILQNTYGCMVYQEQVMQIVRDLAGYSWGRSDLVRRAMSKKKHDVMAKEREYFVHGIVENGEIVVPGAVRNGVSEKIANVIFDEMMDFASYAFNKSHAAAYAIVAYRTAYLKQYYPVEFMTAMINSFLGHAEKTAEYIYSCKAMGLKVLRPDINKSKPRFSVEGDSIRFGLAGVRNVGESVMDELLREREKNGPYRDFFDFLSRCEGLNKRLLEGLIKAGCFDSMGVKRAQLITVYERALDASVNDRKKRLTGQVSLFDMPGSTVAQALSIPIPDMQEFAPAALLSMEREAIGVYISGHPLLEYKKELEALGTTASALIEQEGQGAYRDGDKVRIGGLINSVRSKITKTGGTMGYAVLEDLTGSIEVVAFPSVYTRFSSALRPESAVIVSGRLSMREDQPNSILIDEVTPLSKLSVGQKLFLRLNMADEQLMDTLMALFQRFPGNVPVVLYDYLTEKKQLVPKNLYVNLSSGFLNGANELLGAENVKVKAEG